MDKVITYIDGFNLYFGISEAYQKKYLWLDLEALSENLLRQNQKLDRVHYFTARIRNNHQKAKRQNTYLDALSTRTKIKIHPGKYLNTDVTCPMCHRVYKKPSEKMSDVNLASYLLVDAFQDNYDVAIVISGDSDLTTPISMVRQLFPKKQVIVAFPPCRSSVSLEKTANGYYTIGERNLVKSQLPDPVKNSSGFDLFKPIRWN